MRTCAALVTALLACGPVLAASKEGAPVDATGVELELKGPVRRVVSLAPSITRQILELGLDDRLVGATIFCELGEKSKVKRVGNMLQPSIEKIAALKPDLVLACKEGNRAPIGPKLRSLGLSLFVLDERKGFDDICGEFVLLGRMFGVKEKAETAVRKAKKRVEEIEKRLKKRPRVKVFLAYGTEPIVGAAEGTFGHELIERAGGRNVSAASRARYPRYGAERLILKNPDVVLVVSMKGSAERDRKKWLGMRGLRAAKTGGIHTIPADPVCAPTPSTYCDGLEEMAGILHPEAFEEK